MAAPGKGLLKVVSILFIIFGAISTVVSIIALVGTAVITAVTEGLTGPLVFATILLLVASVLMLVVGILGMKKYADVTKANYFIVSGIVLCVLALVSVVLSLSNFQVTGLIGFLLPILYIVGGVMNKKAAAPPA